MYKKKFVTAIQTAIYTTLLIGISSSIAFSSSHREAPFITEMPKVDASDFYMFNSYEPGREGYVTLLANYLPLQDAYGGPNYFSLDEDALYEIHISNDDDSNEEITFQFDFKNKNENISLDIDGKSVAIPLKQAGQIGLDGYATDTAALNVKESYTVNVVYGDRRYGKKRRLTNSDNGGHHFMKPVDNIGNKTLPHYESYANNHIFNVDIPKCGQGRVFVGQRQDGFAVNLGGIFDLVNFVPIEPSFNPVFEGVGIEQSERNNTIRNKNVTTIAMEVPAHCLTKNEDATSIGGWTTASLKRTSRLNHRGKRKYDEKKNKPQKSWGKWVQVSRLGSPLVNEVVIGLKDKDLFNRSEPHHDGQFADYVTNPTLPALLDILFRDPVNSLLGADIPNLAPTNFPRVDLVTTFLTGFDGLNKTSGVGEMLRLNTAISATAKDDQHHLGVAAGDVAGFPNGRRPGDDVVDVALRVVMGALCHDLPLGPEGGGVNLGLCSPEDAVVGAVPFTDGAPVNSGDFQNAFPYLNTPVAGYPDPSSIL